MSEETECEECEEGAPEWLATFADLMSLLMCFFVLLLSFSEMDLQKYKQVAGSMKSAFGIQRKIEADTIPRGTSVIKQEFSPGKPEPTVMKIINQKTDDDSKPEIQINAPIPERVSELQDRLKELLEDEIDANVLEVLVNEEGVMIRVRDADAFPSGSARLQRSFIPVLQKMQTLLNETDGRIIVEGHTDNVPINTPVYSSNWVLSAARAASVVHYLAEAAFTDPSRIELRAYADTQPVAPNDTAENRAKNRRIEINLRVLD
ncbi:OmpA family protein [bacterium]|nr:OmpA family protein [bacterium]